MEPFITAGVDVGTRSVKLALLAHGAKTVRVLASEITRVEGRRDVRDARAAVRDAWSRALSVAGLSPFDIALVASTGTCDPLFLRAGHFYRRLSQTYGARHLYPDAAGVLDIGALQTRCAVAGPLNQVHRYRVTNRHASCGGEVVDRMAQRLGLTMDEAGYAPALWPLQDSLAERAIAILRTARVKGDIVLVGGMVRNTVFVSTLTARMAESCLRVRLLVSLHGVCADAFGAALLAARRYRRRSEGLRARQAPPLKLSRVKGPVLN